MPPFYASAVVCQVYYYQNKSALTFEGNCEAAEEVVRRRHAREKKKA
jgi:hypothetical protein